LGVGATRGVGGPVPVRIETGVERGFAATAGIGQKDAGPTVLDLARAAAPLTGHAARLGSLPGEAGGVQDKDAFGIGQPLGDVAAQFLPDGPIVPASGADEQLEGATLPAGGRGDRLGGLALQASELAA
jgi:hypothetical protein